MKSRVTIIFAIAVIVCSMSSASASLVNWQSQAQVTNGNVVADTTGWTFDGSAGVSYDYGNLDEDADIGSVGAGATLEYILNFADSSASIAIGAVNGWNNTETNTFKLEQWNDTGVFGVTIIGAADWQFAGTPSVFDTDVHVVFVNRADGRMELYLDGVSKGISTRDGGWVTNGGVSMLGAASNGGDVATGTVYAVGSYNRELSSAEVADLYSAYTTDPELPNTPNPEDNEKGVLLDTDLKWNNPTVAYDPLKYVLHFRPTDPNWLDTVNTAVVDPVVDLDMDGDPDTTEAEAPVDLLPGTMYYWKVNVYEPNGVPHEGTTWSFETRQIIDTHPANTLTSEGEQAEFTVAATNPYTLDDTGLSYQWYKVGTPDQAVGTDSATYTIPSVTVGDAGGYYCVITITAPPEGAGNSSTSSTAALFVKRLLAHWNFEDNLNDDSGNGYDGTAVGTPIYNDSEDPSRAVTGKSLECILDSGDYAEVPAAVLDDIDTQITLSLWTYGVDQPNAGNQHTLVAVDDSDVIVFSMMIPHSTARIWTRIGNPVDGTDGWYEGASAPTSWFSGKWNHWVMTKDSEAGILRVYYNGELWLESTSAFKPVYGATKFYIGGHSGAGAFGGYIDDVRVYNYALSAEEIAEISPRPMLPDPEDGQRSVMFDTNLSWTTGDGSTNYTVFYSTELDDDPNIWLANPTEISGLTEPTADPGVNLALGEQYFWYVEEYDDSANLLWTSDLWDFTVRVLNADIDDNDVVDGDDVKDMVTRWLDDTRGPAPDTIVDSCVYDPNNTDPDDPTSYAHYWDTYYTYTGGNLLFGDGVCVAVDDPNQAIEWTYDTPSSTGGTDCDFIYWHRDREKLSLNQYDKLIFTIKALPGSTMSWALWSSYIDKDDDSVSFNIGTAPLGDNEWHDLEVPLSTLGGIEDMDDMEHIHAGMWSGGLTGTWLIMEVKVVDFAGNKRCVPIYYIDQDVNGDCMVNLEDFVTMAEEWMLDARNL